MKPIVFSTPLVRAILDGRKTQTRRVIKPQPKGKTAKFEYGKLTEYSMIGSCWNETASRKPRYNVGDVLWVQETWRPAFQKYQSAKYMYRADFLDDGVYIQGGQETPIRLAMWRPSIHMPREAARLFLRVTDVRAERLCEISEEDARAAGCVGRWFGEPEDGASALDKFAALWDVVYAKRGYGWDANPFVWVYTFERADAWNGKTGFAETARTDGRLRTAQAL
jgi:hypothetical protein